MDINELHGDSTILLFCKPPDGQEQQSVGLGVHVLRLQVTITHFIYNEALNVFKPNSFVMCLLNIVYRTLNEYCEFNS